MFNQSMNINNAKQIFQCNKAVLEYMYLQEQSSVVCTGEVLYLELLTQLGNEYTSNIEDDMNKVVGKYSKYNVDLNYCYKILKTIIDDYNWFCSNHDNLNGLGEELGEELDDGLDDGLNDETNSFDKLDEKLKNYIKCKCECEECVSFDY
jgi:hypothetical protein